MSEATENQAGEFLVNGHQRPRTVIGPIDWGIAFAWAYRRQILMLCAVPLLAELMASYFLFYDRLARKHLLLIFIGTTATNVWFLISIVLLAIAVTAERPVVLSQFASQAIKHLPKPFLSYFAAVAVVLMGASALILPGLIFLGFMLWAPAFCIGEIAVGDEPASPGGRSAKEEGKEVERGAFKNRSILDLGLVRSIRLAGKNYVYSVQLVLLMLCGALLPGMLIEFSFPESLEFWVQVLKASASSAVTALVVGVWAGSFLTLLPAEAKRELGIVSYKDPRDFYTGKSLPRYEGRLPLQGMLLVISIAASWFFMQTLTARVEMPDSVRLKLSGVSQRDGEVIVDLTLTDDENNFRWFAPDAFHATLPVDPNAQQSPEKERPWYERVNDTKGQPGPDVRELEMLRFDLITASGEKLTDDAISPVYEPLRVVLAFKLPEGERKAPLIVRYGKKRFPFYEGDVPVAESDGRAEVTSESPAVSENSSSAESEARSSVGETL